MRSVFRMSMGVIFLLSSLLFSETYLVGPQRAYKTLQSVANLLFPGDSVLVDGNATYAGGVSFTRAGLSEQKIVLKGVSVAGKRPIISGGVNTVAFISPEPYTHGADHYVFEGFEVTGGSSRGIYHQAHDLTIRDVVVHDCPAQGILGADRGSGSLLIESCEVYRCGSGDRNHQLYLSTDQVNRPGSVVRVQYCYIHDANGGNNIKSRAERNEIYFNWIEGAYYHELELIGPDPDGVDDEWYPRLKREDSDVVGNVLRKVSTAAGNDRNFSVARIGGDATGESHGRYRFVNNTIISGTGAVFRMFDSLESVEMHNNVLYNPTGVVNVMRTVEAQWTQGSITIAGSCNWVKVGALNVPQGWTQNGSGTDPRFADEEGADFRPAEGSPLINAGGSSSTFAEYPFPDPLTLISGEPSRSAGFVNERTAQGILDIGAFESLSGTTVVLQSVAPKRADACWSVQGRKLKVSGVDQTASVRVFLLNGKQFRPFSVNRDAGEMLVDFTGAKVNGLFLVRVGQHTFKIIN